MQYYLLLPNDNEQELSDANLLGESSFGNFWSGGGLKVLMTIVDKQPELLPQCVIKTDTGKLFNIEEFLTSISKLKVI